MSTNPTQFETSLFDRLIVSSESAEAVLSIRFPPADEQRMRELMEKNNQGTITPDERAEMEAFCRIGSFLAIIHAKARLKLQSHPGDGQTAA